MPEIDIWELDGQHSNSTHSSGSSGMMETTAGSTSGQGSGPFVDLIESSNWSRDDVEIALTLAQLVVYGALAYAIMNE